MISTSENREHDWRRSVLLLGEAVITIRNRLRRKEDFIA